MKNPVEKGKSKTLLQAYKKAADNENLDHFKGMLADHQKALEADLQEREELERERAAKKAKKASRKSDAVADDEDDMDIDEDVPAEKPKSKKRKKAEDSEDADEKVWFCHFMSEGRAIADGPSPQRHQRQQLSSSCLHLKHQLQNHQVKRRPRNLNPSKLLRPKVKTMQ